MELELDEMQIHTHQPLLRHTTKSAPYTCSTTVILVNRAATDNCCITTTMHHSSIPPVSVAGVVITIVALLCSAATLSKANPYAPSSFLQQHQLQLQQQQQQQPPPPPVNTQQVPAQVVSGSISNPYIQTTHEILLDLRQQLLTSAIEFDDHFKTLLVNSKRELHNFFRETYGFVYESNAGVFMSMFEGLEQYYANGSGKLTQSLESFYVVLYQKIFQALNRGREFDASYMKCATERMIHLKPMGEAPEKQIQLLKHTLIAARSLYQALNQTIDIIKSIISIVPTSQCTNLINDKLLKYNHLTVIGSQTGLVSVRQPCMKFCEEVIAKCIGRYNLDELNTNWKGFVSLFLDLIIKLTTNYNIQANVQHLDSQISDAVMNFQENGEQVSNEVFKFCGSPKVPQDTHHQIPMRPSINRIRRGASVNNNRLNPSSSTSSRHELVAPKEYSNRLRSFSSSSSDQARASQAQRQLQPQMQAPGGGPQLASQLLSTGGSVVSKPAQLIKDLIASDKKLDSNVLLDRIKDYIISTRLIWQRLGNTVCASNNASESSGSSAAAAGSLLASSTASSRQTNSCFQESFAISDLNTDIRYQKEMRQLIHRMNVIQSRLQEALAGEEVDWNSSELATTLEPSGRPSRPVPYHTSSSSSISGGGSISNPSVLRPASGSGSGGQPPLLPPLPEPVDGDDESIPDDPEDSEEGSGDGDPIDATDPEDEEQDETTANYDTTAESPSTDDRAGNELQPLQPAPTIPPVIGNDIDTDPIATNDPDGASAQKSSCNSPTLVIPGGYGALLVSSCLLGLLSVSRRIHLSH